MALSLSLNEKWTTNGNRNSLYVEMDTRQRHSESNPDALRYLLGLVIGDIRVQTWPNDMLSQEASPTTFGAFVVIVVVL